MRLICLFGAYLMCIHTKSTHLMFQNSALWFYGYNEVSTMTLKKTVSIIFVCIGLFFIIVSIHLLT